MYHHRVKMLTAETVPTVLDQSQQEVKEEIKRRCQRLNL